jgi:uncharacterized protein YdeI (YjbR/CyaY-like superfamily)
VTRAATAPPNSVHPVTRAEWRRWLEENHASLSGVWFIAWKKTVGKPRVEYDEAVEEALCFGWVDSKVNTLDASRSMLWFAPRRPRTGWSAPNKQRVQRMIEQGRMAPAGLAKVEAAKRDGTWSALDAVEALEVPADLAAALASVPPATEHFTAFPRSAKRGILEWIQAARRPATRQARIEETARLASRNERANQWKPKHEN